jgi:hypothetical protein
MADDGGGAVPWDDGPGDDAFDAITGGALGYWRLHEAAQGVRSMLDALFTWRNELNLAVAKPTVPDPDGLGWVNSVEALTYGEAACSQAAIAGIAPLAESLVRKGARRLREHYQAGRLKAKTEQRRGNPADDKFWYLNKWPKGMSGAMANGESDSLEYEHPKVVSNFREIIAALELEIRDLPASSCRLLEAIYCYRDQMLHWGYEWPEKDRAEFADLIQKRKWGAWFTCSSIDGRPWIFFLTVRFIEDAFAGLQAMATALREIDCNLAR